jgi:glycoprotein-N-acetylgalactosamine 3-beta-galactosyltransferase
LIFTDAPLDPEIPHIYFPLMGTRDHSWEKIRRVFRYVYETLGNKYDWYLRADDDSYVVFDNARSLVSEHNPKKALILGYRWGFFEVCHSLSGYSCIKFSLEVMLMGVFISLVTKQWRYSTQ